MTLANRLTLVRFLLPCLFIPALMDLVPYGRPLALLIFLVGTASDWLDGYVARRWNCATDFGRLMDPLADKILVAAALVCFIAIEPKIVRAWMVVAIVSREFVVTGLRLLAVQKGIVISAQALGKHKTAWQMIAIISLLVYEALADIPAHLPPWLAHWLPIVAVPTLVVLFYLVTLLTLLSGILYLWRYRALYTGNI